MTQLSRTCDNCVYHEDEARKLRKIIEQVKDFRINWTAHSMQYLPWEELDKIIRDADKIPKGGLK